MYLLVIQSNAEQLNKENIENREGKATYLSKGIVRQKLRWDKSGIDR